MAIAAGGKPCLVHFFGLIQKAAFSVRHLCLKVVVAKKKKVNLWLNWIFLGCSDPS